MIAHVISEALLLRKLKNLCHGAAASLSYKYPGWRMCCGSDRVLGPLWGELFGAEPCMKSRYCLELPVLPERRGQPHFTRSHTYTSRTLVHTCMCVCVCWGVCLWPNIVVFKLLALSASWQPSHLPSFFDVHFHKDECIRASLSFGFIHRAVSRVTVNSPDSSWLVLVFIISHKMSV